MTQTLEAGLPGCCRTKTMRRPSGDQSGCESSSGVAVIRGRADVEVAVARGDERRRQRARIADVQQRGRQRQRREEDGERAETQEPHAQPSSSRQAAVCSPRRGRAAGDVLAELLGRLGQRRDRADRDVLVRTELEPLVEATAREDAAERVRELLLRLGDEVQLGELGPPDHLAQPDEELRLERGDGELAPVGGAVDAVAGEPAGEEARQRIAAEPVRDEPMRAVRHRGGQVRASAGARAFQQRGEHGGDRAERADREVGRLDAAAGPAQCPRARRPSRGS